MGREDDAYEAGRQSGEFFGRSEGYAEGRRAAEREAAWQARSPGYRDEVGYVGAAIFLVAGFSFGFDVAWQIFLWLISLGIPIFLFYKFMRWLLWPKF